MGVSYELVLMTAAITDFVAAAQALVFSKRESADVSENADTFDNVTLQDLRDDVSVIFNDHNTDTTTNPHNTTIESIGAMDSAEYNENIRQFASKKINIVSRYGGFSDIDLTLTIMDDWFVSFPVGVPILLNEFNGVVPSSSYQLTDVKADPSNSTFSVFVSINAGIAQYSIEEYNPLAPADTIERMRIGTITTDGTTITSAVLEKVTRIGIYRLSTVSAPNAISVSSGVPMLYAGLDWS